jgi:hypothetical protein
VQCQTNDLKNITSTDCQISVGTNQQGGCFQYFNRANGPNAFSTMLYRAHAGGFTAFSLVRDPHFVGIITVQREIRNWNLAVKFHCTDRLSTGFTAGWIGKIGKYTVHSTVRSTGEVKSHFSAAMTPEMDIAVAAELNHVEHKYKIGLALEWNTGLPKKEMGLLSRLRKQVRDFLGMNDATQYEK